MRFKLDGKNKRSFARKKDRTPSSPVKVAERGVEDPTFEKNESGEQPLLSAGIRSWKVSRFHEQEARERYWILRRDIELTIEDRLLRSGFGFERYHSNSGGIDAYIRDLKKKISGKANSRDGRRVCTYRERRDIGRLFYYYGVLLSFEGRISNRLDQLTMLWREMNFVRTRMLSEEGDSERLPFHLDFCKLEAANMGALEEPEVDSLMKRSSEYLGLDNGEEKDEKNAIRSITSLMALLNNLRIRKITEQVYKKRMYGSLLAILISLSVVLFFISDMVVPIDESARQNSEKIAAALFMLKPSYLAIMDEFLVFGVYAAEWYMCVWVLELVLSLIVSTPTAFIFFAGLTGGFFSAIMKFEPSKRLPGDDLYIRWYNSTKPFIGAFGAVITYIVVSSGVFALELNDSGASFGLLADPISGKGFVFGFLTGFTERLILPKLK